MLYTKKSEVYVRSLMHCEKHSNYYFASPIKLTTKIQNFNCFRKSGLMKTFTSTRGALGIKKEMISSAILRDNIFIAGQWPSWTHGAQFLSGPFVIDNGNRFETDQLFSKRTMFCEMAQFSTLTQAMISLLAISQIPDPLKNAKAIWDCGRAERWRSLDNRPCKPLLCFSVFWRRWSCRACRFYLGSFFRVFLKQGRFLFQRRM